MGSVGNNANSIFNSKGELKLHETTTWRSPKGIKYYVSNIGGDYEVWKRIEVPGRGGSGYRIKDVYVNPTKQLMEAIKLEKR